MEVGLECVLSINGINWWEYSQYEPLTNAGPRQVVQLEGRLAVLKAQALTLSSQAVEHEKVSLKLAGALQDTSTKLGAAAAQVRASLSHPGCPLT